MLGLVDPGKAALADRREQLVAVDLLADEARGEARLGDVARLFNSGRRHGRK